VPASGSQTPSMAFAVPLAARHPLDPPHGGVYDDASQASQLRTRYGPASCSAPLRTRPLDHARGRPYRGPGHLPGPDLPWQAASVPARFTSRHRRTLLLRIVPELMGTQ
jgi:hypothetical protein